jgi:hypothetical protein
MNLRVVGTWLSLVSVAAFAAPVHPPAPVASAGQAIYRTGRLPGGEPVVAQREAGMKVIGPAAACMNCHRRSGLGAREGQVSVPPIAGIYLFHPRAAVADNSDLPFVEGMKPERDPYTEASLARAIREGIGLDGKPLSYLMPRYALDDGQMSALIAYLRQLSPRSMPGAGETTLHFAMIVTPEADPTVRDGVLRVLQRFVDDKNHYTRSQGPRMQSSHHMMFKANRHWQLHVWQLSGPPAGWDKQLAARLAAEPVLAVIGSTGGNHWAPIHQFCERVELPCLFPIIDKPVVDDASFDNVYFSRGVLLEADLMAHDLLARPRGADGRRLVQVFREGDVGEDAATELALRLKGHVPVTQVRLREQPAPAEIAAALREVRPGDELVLWLRAPDLAGLGPVPAGVSIAYMSGRMGGLEDAPLPAPWRAIVRMAYPFDLPDHRRVQIDYPLGWFRLRGVPVVSLQAQADAYLACAILSDTLNHMADTFVRDYLVERIQQALGHRTLTGYYPRLGLAPGQPFASKGGYIVRYPDPKDSKIVADSVWITP